MQLLLIPTSARVEHSSVREARPAWRAPLQLLLLAAIVFALGCTPSEKRQAELADIHAKQARAYQDSGQYRASIIEARNVIQKVPAEARGYVLLAGILVELGQYKTALEVLEQAPSQTADSDFSRFKAEALLGRGKFASVLEFIDSKPEVFRDNANQGANLRARSLAGLNRLEEASATLHALLKAEPQNVEALVALADIAVIEEDAEAARSLLNRASETDPGNIDANLLRAKIAILAGDYATAERQLSDTLIQIPQADTITPKKATILSALADVLVKQGRSAEALIYTRILAEAFPGFEVAQEKYREAVALFEAGNLDDAQEKLAELVQEYPNFENANVLLAVIRFQQGDFEQAAAQLNETVDPELVHPEITRITALSNLRSNRPQQALDMLENFSGTAKDARLLTIYGTSALSLQQTQKGVQALEKAIALEPGLTPAYIALATHHKTEGPAGQQKALQLYQT
ncbi:MAG: tetratricopeptide repeat protein, partial [Pseudomonadales bacterium]